MTEAPRRALYVGWEAHLERRCEFENEVLEVDEGSPRTAPSVARRFPYTRAGSVLSSSESSRERFRLPREVVYGG